MSKLKKANVKKKSDRAVIMEQKRLEEEKRVQEEKEKAKRKSDAFKKSTIDAMLPMYTLLFAILGFLFSQLGIFSFIGLILGILSLRRLKGSPKDKYFWITVVSVAICVICGGYWIISMGYILVNHL